MSKIPARTLIAGAMLLGAAATPFGAVAQKSEAGIPDLAGFWARNIGPEDITFEPVPGDRAVPIERMHVDSKDAEEIIAGKFDNPILQPWAREIVKHNAESEIALNHVYEADDACWPSGVPQMLNVREPVQFIQAKDKVTILYQRDHHVRHIYLNQKHSANPKPSWFGESVGHYENGTLVVDTIAILTHKMSVVDNYGTPHTDKLHVIERYRPVNDKDGKRIEVILRIEDPGTFTTPWRGLAFYRPNRDQQFAEVVCAENNRSFAEGSTFGAMPEEKTPAF
jgi:hypothetical protein